jgi:hypothetical protein
VEITDKIAVLGRKIKKRKPNSHETFPPTFPIIRFATRTSSTVSA